MFHCLKSLIIGKTERVDKSRVNERVVRIAKTDVPLEEIQSFRQSTWQVGQGKVVDGFGEEGLFLEQGL